MKIPKIPKIEKKTAFCNRRGSIVKNLNSEFYNTTYNEYAVNTCEYDGQDCRRNWKMVGTLMGKCLRLDLNELTNITNKGRLAVSFSVNHSDVTTGWKGIPTGFTIHPRLGL